MKNSARRASLAKVLSTPARSLISVAVLTALASAAQAEEVVVSDVPVVVTATRTSKTLDEAPSSIEVVDGKTLEREQPKTIGDALLDIPNVDVTAGESPVFTNVQIRGSDPDQITYLVDGVRQDNYTSGFYFRGSGTCEAGGSASWRRQFALRQRGYRRYVGCYDEVSF